MKRQTILPLGTVVAIVLLYNNPVPAMGNRFPGTAMTAYRSTDKVREKTVKQFEKDFPGVKEVYWEKSSVYDKADFTQHGERAHAYYNDRSILVGTIIDKQFSDLPEKARRTILEQYKNYTPEVCALYDDNEDEPGGLVLYTQTFDSWDHYFVRAKDKKTGKEIMLEVSMTGDVAPYTKPKPGS